jgi:hypothetical protein
MSASIGLMPIEFSAADNELLMRISGGDLALFEEKTREFCETVRGLGLEFGELDSSSQRLSGASEAAG